MRKTIVETIKVTAPEISVFEGRIATGDQFISSKETKNAIRDTFHAMCCEMEGAAIAHAAYLNQIPFVVMRYISDKADESAEVSYPEFEAAAAKHSAELIVSVIRNM